MVKRIELLVHAGAPSSRKDDDRYKGQAEAYFDFKGRRHALNASPIASGAHRDDTTVVVSSTVFLDDTQLAITGLESQLLTSSLPIASVKAVARSNWSHSLPEDATSPSQCQEANPPDEETVSKEDLLAQIRTFGKRKRDDNTHDISGSCPNDSDRGQREDTLSRGSRERDARSSAVPSLSSYLETPTLDRLVKKRRLDQVRSGRSPSAALPPYVNFRDGSQQGIVYVGHRQDATRGPEAPAATAPAAIVSPQNSLAVSEPTSELPTSYSLSDITSESSRPRIRLSERSASEPTPGHKGPVSSAGHGDSSTVSGSSGMRSDNRPAASISVAPADKAARRKAVQEVIVIPDDSLATDDLAVIQPPTGTNTTSRQNKASTVPLQANRPTSTALLAPVTALATEALHQIRALSASIRPPEPDVSIQLFTTHITPALAGLPVNRDMAGRYDPLSVAREIQRSERGHWLFDPSSWVPDRQVKFWQFMEQAIGNGGLGWGIWCSREGATDGLGVIKVYCWGEVVKHVYLLLYVAGGSQIRKLGAQWVDAGGSVVVQMKKATAR